MAQTSFAPAFLESDLCPLSQLAPPSLSEVSQFNQLTQERACRVRGKKVTLSQVPFHGFFPPPHPPTSDLLHSRLLYFHLSLFFFSYFLLTSLGTIHPTPTDPSELQSIVLLGYPKSHLCGAKGGESLRASFSASPAPFPTVDRVRQMVLWARQEYGVSTG